MTNLTLNYSNIKSINQSVRIIKKILHRSFQSHAYFYVERKFYRIVENMPIKIYGIQEQCHQVLEIHNEQIILGYIPKMIKESHSRNIQACKLSVIQGSLVRTRKRNELITVNLNILPSFPRPRNPPVLAPLQASPLCFRFLYLLANNKTKYINLSICH